MQVRRGKRTRGGKLTKFAELQRQRITKRIGSKGRQSRRAQRCNLQDGAAACARISFDKAIIVAKGTVEREKRGTSVLSEHKRSSRPHRAGFYYSRVAPHKYSAFFPIYCK